MNSSQRRKHKRKYGYYPCKTLYGYYHIYRDDTRCKEAIKKTQKLIPDFLHCGKGKGGYITLICNDCPALLSKI